MVECHGDILMKKKIINKLRCTLETKKNFYLILKCSIAVLN